MGVPPACGRFFEDFTMGEGRLSSSLIEESIAKLLVSESWMQGTRGTIQIHSDNGYRIEGDSQRMRK